MSKIKLSIIIPFYNESSNLKKLHQELKKMIEKSHFKSEVIYIDDGSNDNGYEILSSFKNSKNTTVKLLKLNKHSGQSKAILKGINNSKGELIAFLDADLQNYPKDLLKMVDKIKEGYDAIFGWRKNRADPLSKKIPSQIANSLIRLFFNSSLHDLGCSIKVVKKETLLKTSLFGQFHRILPLLIIKRGAKTAEIVVNHRKRASGRSKYGYFRVFNLLADLLNLKFSS